jgi:two-component system nitrogen regulation response regulator GlnG/two-component system response regulator HydG
VDETKTEEGVRAGKPRGTDSTEDPGLVVLFSAEGAEHVGAWMPVPEGKGRILGRGPAQGDDELVRLRPGQQRPGELSLLGPFQHQALSRVQLLVERVAPAELELRNRGRCRLLINGTETDGGTVRPGDFVELGGQLALLCATRLRKLAGPPPAPGHEFGGADAHGLVGEAQATWRLRAEIAAVGSRAGHVLVLGETGTGKELVARALHASSKSSGKLVPRNAATLPESLVDAELFGNLKDYPNPGMPDRRGLIAAADEGTLFLDEFAELPEKAQAHLLRALDAGEYQRLGETTVRHSRFRLIAATNRPESALRRDLLERFPFRIRLPRLRERLEDLPFIARHLFAQMKEEAPDLCGRFCDERGAPRLDPRFLRALSRHPFDGNVRELRALLWSSLHESSEGEWLELPSGMGGTGPAAPPPDAGHGDAGGDAQPQGERQRILSALESCGGNQRRAAELLGVSRRTLVRRIAELGLPRPKDER